MTDNATLNSKCSGCSKEQFGRDLFNFAFPILHAKINQGMKQKRLSDKNRWQFTR